MLSAIKAVKKKKTLHGKHSSKTFGLLLVVYELGLRGENDFNENSGIL